MRKFFDCPWCSFTPKFKSATITKDDMLGPISQLFNLYYCFDAWVRRTVNASWRSRTFDSNPLYGCKGSLEPKSIYTLDWLTWTNNHKPWLLKEHARSASHVPKLPYFAIDELQLIWLFCHYDNWLVSKFRTWPIPGHGASISGLSRPFRDGWPPCVAYT